MKHAHLSIVAVWALFITISAAADPPQKPACDVEGGYGYLADHGAGIHYVAYHFDFENTILVGDINTFFDHAYAGIGVPLEDANSGTMTYLIGTGFDLNKEGSPLNHLTNDLLRGLTDEPIFADFAIAYQQEGDFDLMLGLSMRAAVLTDFGGVLIGDADELEKLGILPGFGKILQDVGNSFSNIESVPGASTLKAIGCTISELIQKPVQKEAAKAGEG
ncbi:MAG: hypothetical protein AAF585_14605 [Verrucomicrobiota bacterium]